VLPPFPTMVLLNTEDWISETVKMVFSQASCWFQHCKRSTLLKSDCLKKKRPRFISALRQFAMAHQSSRKRKLHKGTPTQFVSQPVSDLSVCLQFKSEHATSRSVESKLPLHVGAVLL
jgi:hypothetical protein